MERKQETLLSSHFVTALSAWDIDKLGIGSGNRTLFNSLMYVLTGGEGSI